MNNNEDNVNWDKNNISNNKNIVFRFLNQKGNFSSSCFYDSIHQDFFLKKPWNWSPKVKHGKETT